MHKRLCIGSMRDDADFFLDSAASHRERREIAGEQTKREILFTLLY